MSEDDAAPTWARLVRMQDPHKTHTREVMLATFSEHFVYGTLGEHAASD